MAYVIAISPIVDFGGYLGGGIPTFFGSIYSPPPPSPLPASGPGSPLSSAATTPPAATTLTFTFPPPTGPAGPSAVIIAVMGSLTGDVFRSGPLASLPDSSAGPAPLAWYTAPLLTISAATFAARVAGLAPPPVVFPPGGRVVAALATGGLLIPLALTVTGIGITPGTTLGPGPTLASLTITGTLVVRQFYFFVITHAFTLTVTLALTPSSDVSVTARVFSVTATASTLTATGVPGFVSALVAPFAGVFVASIVESSINGSIASGVAGEVTAQGLALSPTAVVSALTPTITASGIAIRLGVADLRGPGLTPIPILKNLSVTVSPTPVPNQSVAYTITVTDAATSAPVNGANVTLVNYTQTKQQTVTHFITDSMGQVKLTVVLRSKVVSVWKGGEISRMSLVPPILTVTHEGFNPWSAPLWPPSVEEWP